LPHSMKRFCASVCWRAAIDCLACCHRFHSQRW
jgi:hypothetical protein